MLLTAEYPGYVILFVDIKEKNPTNWEHGAERNFLGHKVQTSSIPGTT